MEILCTGKVFHTWPKKLSTYAASYVFGIPEKLFNILDHYGKKPGMSEYVENLTRYRKVEQCRCVLQVVTLNKVSIEYKRKCR